MEYFTNLRDTINNTIINYFFTKNQSNESEVITFTEYKDFMISDNPDTFDNLKQSIERFNTICENVPEKSIEYFNLPNLTLKESIYSLDILISRPDIMNYLEENKNDYTDEVVSVIAKLYLNIFKIYNTHIDNEKDIIKKSQLNFNLCEIIIKYTFVFTHPAFSKFFFDLWKYNIKKYYLLAKTEGCLISWITFSILCPSLANNNCYPIINKDAHVFKHINWEYVKSKIYNTGSCNKKFNLFLKYYVDK
jgi:hypothetical protein